MRNYFPVSKCSGSGFPGVLDSKSKTWYATQFHTNTKNSQKSSPNNENCLVRSVHIPVKQTATCVLFPVSKDTLEIHPWFLSPFLWLWWRGSQQKWPCVGQICIWWTDVLENFAVIIFLQRNAMLITCKSSAFKKK